MAIIGKPCRKWNVDNCVLAKVESFNKKSTEYTQNTDKYLIELDSSSRIDIDQESENNPTEFTITGKLKD